MQKSPRKQESCTSNDPRVICGVNTVSSRLYISPSPCMSSRFKEFFFLQNPEQPPCPSAPQRLVRVGVRSEVRVRSGVREFGQSAVRWSDASTVPLCGIDMPRERGKECSNYEPPADELSSRSPQHTHLVDYFKHLFVLRHQMARMRLFVLKDDKGDHGQSCRISSTNNTAGLSTWGSVPLFAAL